MKLLELNHIRYGLIMCGVLLACLLLMEVTGQNTSFDKSPIIAFTLFITPAVIWFLAIRKKKQLQKNRLTWKQGIIEAFKVSLVFGIISPFIFAGYYLLINPDIVDYVRKSYGLLNATNSTVILTDMMAQFVSAIIMGAVYGAIISFFLRTKPKAKKK